MHLRFLVVAGKYDGFERITKYVDCFDWLGGALATVTQKSSPTIPDAKSKSKVFVRISRM